METKNPISEVVDDTGEQSLLEDREDLEVAKARKKEPVVDFHRLVAGMKRRGLLSATYR